MADEWVSSKLRSWDLVELIPRFQKNHIDKEAFKLLDNKEAVAEIIQDSVGLKLKFMAKFKIWLDASEKSDINENYSDDPKKVEPQEHVVEGNSQNCVIAKQIIIAETENQSNSEMNIEEMEVIIQPEITASTSTTASVPQSVIDDLYPQETSVIQALGYEDFMKILKSNVFGHLFLARYEKYQQIDKKYLAEGLMPTLMVLHKDYQLTKKDWDRIMQLLKRYASKAKPADCYVPKNSSSDSTGGACYYFYRTTLGDLKKEGLIPTEAPPPEKMMKSSSNIANSALMIECEGVDPEDVIPWLTVNVGEYDVVFPKWQISFVDRSLLDYNIGIQAQLDRFAPLRQSFAHKLLGYDFDMTWTNEADIFGKSWPGVAELIVKVVQEDSCCNLAKTYYKQNKSLIAEGKTSLLALLLLPLLEDIKTIKTKWRPTKIEVKDGFILHVETLDQLKEKQEAKVTYYKKHGCDSMQPYVIYVGDLKQLDTCMIQVNDIQYVVDDPVKAVEFCYKIFFVLNAEYPPESKHVWMFLQQYVFKMKTKETTAPVDNLCQMLDIKKAEIEKNVVGSQMAKKRSL